MKKLYHQFEFFLLFAAMTFSFPGFAQQFAANRIPYPEGPAASLDTIFYTPTTPMPFDQAFVLKITLKGDPKIRYFAINPVDRNGKIHWTRRDYRIAIREMEPDPAQRSAFKKSYTWENFKSSKLGYVYPDVRSYNKGANTDVFIHVTPLSPNRQYQIILLSDDNTSLKTLQAIGSYIFDTVTFPPQQNILDEINIKLSLMKSKNRAKGTVFSNPMNADGAIDLLAHDTLTFLRDIHPRTVGMIARLKSLGLPPNFRENSSYLYRRRYHLYFKSDQTNMPFSYNDLGNMKPDQYLDTIPEGNPVEIALKDYIGTRDQLKDVGGRPIDLHSNGKFKLYLACYEELYEVKTKQNAIVELVSFNEIGDFEEKNNGKSPEFTVKPGIPGADFFSMNRNVNAAYQDLKNTKTTLAGTVTYIKDSVSAYKAVMDEALKCPCSDKGIKDMTQANDLFHIIGTLNVATAAQWDNLRSGLLSTKDLIAAPAGIDDYSTRQSNINFSLKQLQLLVEFLSALQAHDPSQARFSRLYASVTTLIKNMQTVSDDIDKVNKLNNTIIAAWRGAYQGLDTQNSLVSTETLDFTSANKLRIIPDFGLMGVFTGDRVFHFSDLVPFLGFEVDFRSINKNLPMKLVYNKNIWYYLSFSAGLTLTSIAIPNKRSNLFGDQNIYTGLGIRINNSLRVTGGTVWFKTVNSDPLQTNQPLGFSPYIALSLDLDLQNLFGGINKLFKP